MSTAPETERLVFLERVRQSRETLARTFRVEEEPPSDLFDRIVAQLPAAGDRADAEPATPAIGTAQPAEPTDELAQARKRRAERRPSGTRRWLVGVAAAAAIALGGVGVGAYLADQNDPVNQVVRAGDLREASAQRSGRRQGHGADLRVGGCRRGENERRTRSTCRQGLPDVAHSQGRIRPGIAGPDGRTGTLEACRGPKGIHSAASLGITVEPAGGSKSPTLPTVAAAPLGA